MTGAPSADRSKIRLFVDAPLARGVEVTLSREQAHYLGNVMRCGVGDAIALFNGRDGEWAARLACLDRKRAVAGCEARSAPQSEPPDLWLLFAPIKKARTDFIAEKACELGCRVVQPVITRFTNAERVNTGRLRAHAVEAAEQCGLVSVPEMRAPMRLDALLDGWDGDRFILFCDERRDAPPAATILRASKPGRWAVLIGPEGGFAPEEVERLRGMPCAASVSLGPRVLRADTAAVAALSIWQSVLGDWA